MCILSGIFFCPKGTLDGYDWTPVAVDVMPYGNVSYTIMKNLWEKVSSQNKKKKNV